MNGCVDMDVAYQLLATHTYDSNQAAIRSNITLVNPNTQTLTTHVCNFEQGVIVSGVGGMEQLGSGGHGPPSSHAAAGLPYTLFSIYAFNISSNNNIIKQIHQLRMSTQIPDGQVVEPRAK